MNVIHLNILIKTIGIFNEMKINECKFIICDMIEYDYTNHHSQYNRWMIHSIQHKGIIIPSILLRLMPTTILTRQIWIWWTYYWYKMHQFGCFYPHLHSKRVSHQSHRLLWSWMLHNTDVSAINTKINLTLHITVIIIDTNSFIW